MDTTASDMLEELDETLNAHGTSLVFAELMDPVRDKIERYGLTRTIDPRHFFPTIGSAVAASAGKPAPNGPPPTGPLPATRRRRGTNAPGALQILTAAG